MVAQHHKRTKNNYFKNHYPKWLIIEIGADRPGGYREYIEWLKPDVVVITHLPDVPVHVEFF